MENLTQALKDTIAHIENYVVGQSSLLQLDENDKDSIYIIKCKIWDAIERLKKGADK